ISQSDRRWRAAARIFRWIVEGGHWVDDDLFTEREDDEEGRARWSDHLRPATYRRDGYPPLSGEEHGADDDGQRSRRCADHSRQSGDHRCYQFYVTVGR